MLDVWILPDLLSVRRRRGTWSAGEPVEQSPAICLRLPRSGGGPPHGPGEVHLDPADAGQLSLLRLRAGEALVPMLKAFLLGLPLPQRLLALHDFGRVRRALGEGAVPVAEDASPLTLTQHDDGPRLEEVSP